MIEYLSTWVFYLIPAPLLILWLVRPASVQEAALHVPMFNVFSNLEADSSLSIKVNPSLFKRALLLLIWLALILAASRPQLIGEPIQLPVSGRDLMLAVDISKSMAEEDMLISNRPATRLSVVKSVVGAFVQRRKGDRIGLILFGSQAYLQTPLTFDRNTVRTLLMETPLGIAGLQTAIGDAIGLAVKRLKPRPAENRVLILLTDGVNTAGEVSPLQAAKIAQKEGIRIYTIGFGADQTRSRGGIFGRTLNPSAQFDEKALKEIADLTGGRFYRARSRKELRDIYNELDRLEPVEQDQETYRPVKSLFFWPLAFAFIASLIAVLLHPSSIHWLTAFIRRTPAKDAANAEVRVG